MNLNHGWKWATPLLATLTLLLALTLAAVPAGFSWDGTW